MDDHSHTHGGVADAERQSRFQKEVVYNKLLPYSDCLDGESSRQLVEIKTNLSLAVQLRELRPGVVFWTGKFSSYIRYYGRKFSKEEHIAFINLYLELLNMPDLEFKLMSEFARILIMLLKKRNLLSRDDITIPWKPLYKIVERVIYSQYEPLGLEWFPHSLENRLKSLIRVSRPYFSVESTQEMLDEWRPLLCPFDETMTKGILYIEAFMPTLLPPEQHQKGFKLWLDEMINIWNNSQNSPCIESALVDLFSRLASENIGYIDWTPHIPKIFTCFLRGLSLPVGSKKLQVARNGKGFDVGPLTTWIVSMLGHTNTCQEHLKKFFVATDSYFHPSNTGKYSFNLQRMLFHLANAFVKRVNRERYKKPSWQHPIPDSHKLTDEDITAFVDTIKAPVFLAMYSKMGHRDAASALHNLALLRPELVVPPLMEKTYKALDTLTEPHQLIATVSCVVAVAGTMLKGGKWLPDGPTHLLPLLHAILPGIDPNDFAKCMVTLQAMSTFTVMVPLVDCSEAPLVREDLTEQERDLCSATATFEDFVLLFMDRCFNLIEACSIMHTRSQDNDQERANHQETMVDIGLSSTFCTICSQSSPQIYKATVDRLFRYVSTSILETKVSGKIIANMCRAAAKVDPAYTLKKFVPHCSQKILDAFTSEEVQEEEELDKEILFNLQVLGEVIRVPSEAVLVYKDTLMSVLKATLHVTCKAGYDLACQLLKNWLRAMSLSYPREFCSVAKGFDRPLTEYLPIRDWGKPGDIHNLDVKWHQPSEEGVACIKDILDTFLQPEIKKLRDYTKGEVMSREKLLQSLIIVSSTLLGAGAVIPRWHGYQEPDMKESQVPLYEMLKTIGSEDKHHLFKGLREELASVMHDLLVYLLATGEDDTKSLILIININYSLLFYQGAEKKDYDNRWKGFLIIKKGMEDRLHGKKKHLRALLIDRVCLQHEMRMLVQGKLVCTELDKQIQEDLFTLATSRYSEVRKKAQNFVFLSADYYVSSYTHILPKILANLKPEPSISHHQFKGALYLLYGYGMNGSMACPRSWPLLRDCWLALVKAGHSEKPSIMKVMSLVTCKINKVYNSMPITSQVSDDSISRARELVQGMDVKITEEQGTGSLQRLQEENSESMRVYQALVADLVELIEHGNLRWKFSQMAAGLLRLLVRQDVAPPTPMVRLFVTHLVHETLHQRKLALSTVGAILKQLKRPHKKVPMDPYAASGSPTPPADALPSPGERPDNKWIQYQCDRIPTTQEKWDQCVFVDKTHWGYYVWPKTMLVYAPMSEQPKLDRSREELSEVEQVFYDHFSSHEFVEKLVGFLSLEDKKGKDKFDAKKFMVFKGLFRNFGDTFLPLFKPHLERLSKDSQESSQRSMMEIIAGLIRGSKHWGFAKSKNLWEEVLLPAMKTSLSLVTGETIIDWGVCMATSCESRDPRKLHWLFEWLTQQPLSEDEERGSFLDASRLFVLQGGLFQQEWRVPGLLHRLLGDISKHLTHSYKNVRDKIGSFLVMIFMYDNAWSKDNKTASPHRQDFLHSILPQLAPLANIEVWGAVEVSEEDRAEDDERRRILRLCKTVMKWITGSLGNLVSSAPSDFFQYLPLLAPLESCESDEELRFEAEVTLACLAQALLQSEMMPQIFSSLQQIGQGSSWRAKCSMLEYLQVMVFYNLFTIGAHPGHVETIGQLVLERLKDDRLEVREIAGATLSGLIHCGFLPIGNGLQNHFENLCKTHLPTKTVVSSASMPAEAIVQRHAGILGLSACVQAYPYDVPGWMPRVLMDLTDHLHDPQPIERTVRKTLSDFRRTHHDNWHEHKQQFTDDQLVVLTDLLVSPCYYA
ncbi:proteasome activator complex subunit 4-like [Diadema setosum]|uniref:proteasome activator complex subunit 4-like n=1 Tax=Diadema setosum TaxID=31175 RepID=UPI003B3A93A9